MFWKKPKSCDIIDAFHRIYYDARKTTWMKTSWLGVDALKCPLDLWVYQELIFAQRPDAIVETGTNKGGSALFLASICDLIGHGKIMTIDIESPPGLPAHERITYVTASSTAPEAIEKVKQFTEGAKNVLVLLDSDHRRDHVLDELRLYRQFPRIGNYMVVEDTNINGHPVFDEFGPGPMEAVDAFLAECKDFEIDAEKEKFLLTFNPRGFLKRKR